MDPVNRKTVRKSRLARTFTKVLHIRAATSGVVNPEKSKSREKFDPDHQCLLNAKIQLFIDAEEKLKQRAAAEEAFLAKLFASVSAIKASYAHLQFYQSPYNADGIQSSDHLVVSELKSLSELKQCYFKKQFDDDSSSHETTHLLAEIREQKSLLQIYEITAKKLDSELKLKNSEITFLEEKLEEANGENKLFEKRLNSSGQLSSSNLSSLDLSGLCPRHFITVLRQTNRSVRSFVKLLIGEMELSGWDLDAAAASIQKGIVYWKANHKCYAFESFVCRIMFDGFNYPYFSLHNGTFPEQKKKNRQSFLDEFMELKSTGPKEYLDRKPKSTFAEFCRTKYLRLVHPKLELSLFGNLNQRNVLKSTKFPETAFFATFFDMAKRVWLLHCLALACNPEASIFQVSKGCRFSEVYMESLSDEAILASDGSPGNDPRVAFVVVPGFKIGKTVIQCQVYLS